MNLRSLLTSAALADEFARLRADLTALDPIPRHIVVLGAAGGEGVTTVATHLALALCGQPGAGRVLLAEGNLRSPALDSGLGLSPGPGLLDWDMRSALPVKVFDGAAGLEILTAGAAAKAIGGPSVEERLYAACVSARAEFECVVWDAPPVSTFADGLTLAGLCDGALVVVEMDQSRVDGLGYLRTSLERAHARILGSVLNRTGRYWPRAAKKLPV